MPLRSPSGICWASANGSPEAIQEFVVRESSRNPHCQLGRPASAATLLPFFSHLPLLSSFSGATFGKGPMSAARFGFHSFGWCSLAQDRFTAWLNIFGLPVSGGASNEEGSPLDACFYLRNGDSGPFCPH